MHVREAVEDDTDAIATLAEAPTEAVHRLIRERTVRVADQDGLVGLVAFDAQPDVVPVTRLCGERDVMTRLLDEPVSFANTEDMAVEVVVPESAPETTSVVESYGFTESGAGPRFHGEQTRRYRFTP